ncbi:DUF4189 domain-containing protein [Xanthomonas campestris pv. raphani]|uniref:DUF4189 domain-containing protein n=1 Tax=Xanthomonas TaxID=338 RepID=UPI00061A2C06|nr:MULTISPECIES: DUF4189 domain-containing protein [Xanthomonas]AKC78661.1 hypothetical protein XB05_07930 [Xanthomonas arboricola]MCC8686916.1 DUF4189 domain-containing protein [Xanthomonas campestris]MCC8691559.1 DUF4189 domain-containing protein [Xanthomonas campestris]MCW1998830.1 hypothetical protein [Xanthomonas campestris]MEA9680232.1 DUF4189 domain-containing protein [Xanthomonas campestris pv. raphani]
MRYLLFVFLFLANNAYAQTACPNGVAPGSPQCGPDSGTSRGEIPLPPPQPTGEWIKTWGAIVNSRETSQAWASLEQTSKESAEEDAIDQCKSAGFKGCYVTFTYFNQCVAMASSASGTSASGVSSAANISIASRNALNTCRENGGAGCSVIYKDCTKPIFKKY